MAAVHPTGNLASLANLISLPARHFAVIDAGSRRARVLVASVSRGKPTLRRSLTIDSHEEGFSTAEELREDVRQMLRKEAPEALILVAPQSAVLRHVLEVPPGDPSQTRMMVEREASRIGGLSESQWAFDSVRLKPFGGIANPVAAVFCRQTDLQDLLEGFVDDTRLIFDVRPAGDSLAAAYHALRPEVADAVLIDLGAMHTGVTVMVGRQVVFSSSFPSGSQAFTEAIATDRGCGREAAEVLKRTEPPQASAAGSAAWRAALGAWLADVERTVQEWREDHPALDAASNGWPMVLAGGGALQAGLAVELKTLSQRPVEPWPESGEGSVRPDQATAWGALLLSLGLGGSAPSLLPQELRGFWTQQRLWRGLLTFNLLLSAILALALYLGMQEQQRLLNERKVWREAASTALQHARNIRSVAEGFNTRLDVMRPVLEQQRQTVETLQILSVLQQQRTNATHWYVLLADATSYAAGSNDFQTAGQAPRTADVRSGAGTAGAATNVPPSSRTFVAEVCLVPQGEEMRRALSELVGDLKRYPLFRNVDVLPSERRRDLVSTNLIFPERHFALELNLSEAELLPVISLPRLAPTNREPRAGLRMPVRFDAATATNGTKGGRAR